LKEATSFAARQARESQNFRPSRKAMNRPILAFLYPPARKTDRPPRRLNTKMLSCLKHSLKQKKLKLNFETLYSEKEVQVFYKFNKKPCI